MGLKERLEEIQRKQREDLKKLKEEGVSDETVGGIQKVLRIVGTIIFVVGLLGLVLSFLLR
ncbi:MAG: hypothetical protein DDT23_00005 [candidate division WS2 bacterium]|nr:hypothetical protein [Candidatus Lithacetigena glycinireducens]